MFIIKNIVFLLIMSSVYCIMWQSPCPSVFQYDNQQMFANSWGGRLFLYSNSHLNGVSLKITFDKLPTFLQNLDGWHTIRESSGYTLSNPTYILPANKVQMLNMKAFYFGAKPLPQVTMIYLNGKIVCPVPKVTFQPTTPLPTVPSLVSPCPDIFIYESFQSDRWYGLLNLKTDQVQSGVTLKLILDNEALELGNWFGQVKTGAQNDYVIDRSDFTLSPGNPVVIRFYVRYDPKKPMPKLSAIEINSEVRCKDPNYVPNTIHIREGDKIVIDTQRIEEVCGTVIPKSTALIVRGQTTEQSEWPWHAVLFVNGKYICGGSLISYSHVLTAAHCVYDSKRKRSIPTSKLLVYLGKQYLERWGRKIQDFSANRIDIYPTYDHMNYFKNDLAVITLDQEIEFNEYVRPICVWSEGPELDPLYDNLGTVVGFGFDEERELTKELHKANLLVVPRDSCILSYPEFFSKALSENSYCGGFRNGTSPCNGDSGGGLVYKTGPRKRWQVRGIVSSSVSDDGVCDTSHYVIFTDVARFKDWIVEKMREMV